MKGNIKVEVEHNNCHKFKEFSTLIGHFLLVMKGGRRSCRTFFPLVFVCFGSVPAFVPWGQLPREDLRRAPLPPRPLVTPGPRCSSCSLSPNTYCHASCIKSVPSPVLLSYTDILPIIWSAPSLSSCPTHIINPHTYKLCYLLISTALS